MSHYKEGKVQDKFAVYGFIMVLTFIVIQFSLFLISSLEVGAKSSGVELKIILMEYENYGFESVKIELDSTALELRMWNLMPNCILSNGGSLHNCVTLENLHIFPVPRFLHF